MNAGIKINRIKAADKTHMNTLEEVLGDGVALHKAAPNVALDESILLEQGAMEKTAAGMGKYVKAGGFDPTRKFQHVAHIPNTAVWNVVQKMFAQHDAYGNLVDDGKLYKTDPRTGQPVLNKPFFYALLDGPLRRYDLRGKLKVD